MWHMALPWSVKYLVFIIFFHNFILLLEFNPEWRATPMMRLFQATPWTTMVPWAFLQGGLLPENSLLVYLPLPQRCLFTETRKASLFCTPTA